MGNSTNPPEPSRVASPSGKGAADGAARAEGLLRAGDKPLKRGLLLLSVGIAFRGALWAKELLLGLALAVAACPEASITFKPGGGGIRVHGLESCQGGAALVVGLFGMFASGLLAGPILMRALRRRSRPRNRFVAATGYLFGLASAVEVLSATLVFPVLNRFEAAAVHAAGLNRFLVMPVGLALGCVFWWLSMQTARRFVVDFLGWPESKVPPFRKAVLFKLSAGTLLVSALRVFIG